MKTNQRTATAESTQKESEAVEGECPECNGELVNRDTEIYCEQCGLVDEEQIVDRGPEWRAFDAKEDNEKSRVGDPLSAAMHDRGLSTTVGGESDNLDEKGRRLQKWQKRTVMGNGKERGLQYMMKEIHRLTSELNLPTHVKEGAANIVRKASKENLVYGRSYESVAAGSVLLASRIGDKVISLTELMSVATVEERRVQRTSKKIQKDLDLEVPPPDPRDYVDPFLEDLRHPIHKEDSYQEYKNCVKRVIGDAIEENVHSGCDPRSVVGGAVYVAAKKRGLAGDVITQKMVGDAFDISNVTIRNSYQKIEEARSLD